MTAKNLSVVTLPCKTILAHLPLNSLSHDRTDGNFPQIRSWHRGVKIYNNRELSYLSKFVLLVAHAHFWPQHLQHNWQRHLQHNWQRLLAWISTFPIESNHLIDVTNHLPFASKIMWNDSTHHTRSIFTFLAFPS